MKTFRPLLKIAVILCFMLTGKAVAQSQNITTAATKQTVNAKQTSFNAEALKNITKAVENVTTAKPQLAETKIQKRIRKKKDPILIPYALNKKTFSIC
ncbi:MAG: hypothetical protein ACLGH8_15615 [Bacteroidia bacterium]|jgi:hypothetical protein